MKYSQIQSYTDSQFKRLIGVDQATFTEMVSVVKAAEALKRKSGRPSKLSTEDQILLTFSYLREYRTLFHVAADYGIHESNAQRMVVRIENILIQSGLFSLPKKPQSSTGEVDWDVIVVDVTETPIERPKKAAQVLQRQEKASHVKNPNRRASGQSANSKYCDWLWQPTRH